MMKAKDATGKAIINFNPCLLFLGKTRIAFHEFFCKQPQK